MDRETLSSAANADNPAPMLIREARPEDAPALITYFRRLFGESGINLITEADEFSPTVEAESRFIREMARASNSIFLVAEIDHHIIGQLTLEGGKRRNVKHAAVLGITVAQEWRGQGIGHRLLAQAIGWARAGGVISRIELHVFVRNERATRLYQEFGFVVEGRRREAVIRDGQYLDDWVMGLLLETARPPSRDITQVS
ncbi:MAG: GNAT family N-acetyltransferase [Candidatus Promineofilum sp.]|nr:GNAT family N-acetyltransferase [Promineifilum sp.]